MRNFQTKRSLLTGLFALGALLLWAAPKSAYADGACCVPGSHKTDGSSGAQLCTVDGATTSVGMLPDCAPSAASTNNSAATQAGVACCDPGTRQTSSGVDACMIAGTITQGASRYPDCSGAAAANPAAPAAGAAAPGAAATGSAAAAPPPPPPVSVAAQNAAKDAASQLAKVPNEKPIDTQKDSLLTAGQLFKLGSSKTATIGALFCAEGANQSALSPADGAAALGACGDFFKTADELNKLEAKNGLSGSLVSDPSILALDSSKSTLSDFEKNFDVKSDDYMAQMMSTRGNRSTLTDMMGKSLSSEQIATAFSEADKVKGTDVADAEKYLPATTSSPSTVVSKVDSPRKKLRDELRKRLEEAADKKFRESSEEEVLEQTSSLNRTLAQSKDAHLDPDYIAFSHANEVEELSIFQVVHRKYEECTPRFKGEVRKAN